MSDYKLIFFINVAADVVLSWDGSIYYNEWRKKSDSTYDADSWSYIYLAHISFSLNMSF